MIKTCQYTCPDCGAIGASNYKPLCHICNYKVYMEKSINGKIISIVKNKNVAQFKVIKKNE